MSDLKTLKDMDVRQGGAIWIYELKAEAVKIVKSFEGVEKTFTIEDFKWFLNIEEEDLK